MFVTILFYAKFAIGADLLHEGADLHHHRCSKPEPNLSNPNFSFYQIVFLHFSLKCPAGNLQQISGLATIPQVLVQAFLNQSSFPVFKCPI